MTLPESARPEQLLAFAMIQRAMADTIAGDAEALAWLEGRALAWLELVSPADVDPGAVLQRILRRVDPGNPLAA